MNPRGARGGLGFATPVTKKWLEDLLDYVANRIPNGTNRNWSPVIAYISAANEVNNLCGVYVELDDRRKGLKDCFDVWAGHENPIVANIGGTIGEVKAMNQIVKSRPENILTTVGLSTEMVNVDQSSPIISFFKCRQPRLGDNPNPCSYGALATYVDFLSIHNYGGGAQGFYEQIKALSGILRRSTIVLLEEYGWPTDPKNQDPTWMEGTLADLNTPSATHYINANQEALRISAFSGGIVYMLADAASKDCNGDFDSYVGLIVVGGGYTCGGTGAHPDTTGKATFSLVQQHLMEYSSR